ncbi:MAG: AAA family ATPase [Myxococcaceae bacterium]
MSDPFVGRAKELEVLGRLLGDALASRTRFALLSGEPGIGKSRLAEELCSLAVERGAVTAWARAWEGEATPAFWLVRQLLKRLEKHPKTKDTLQRLTSSDEVLAAMVHGAGERSRLPEQARLTLFEAVADALAQLAAAAPLVLVLDDLHVADLGSLSLLAFVARQLRDARVLLVGTARDASFHPGPETSKLLADAARDATVLPLSRLKEAEVGLWLQQTAPARSAEAKRLHELSEGNPLFVQELLAASSNRLPLGIAGALRAHLDQLSAPSRALLQTASVLGRDFDRAGLERLAGAGDALRSAIDEGETKSVLVAEGDGGLRFSHALLRDALYAELESSRRAALHRAASAGSSDPIVAVHHALLGLRPEDAEGIARRAIDGARQYTARLAFEDAGQLAQRTLQALEAQLPPKPAAELWLCVGEAQMFGGDPRNGQASCERAVELFDRAQDFELMGRAALTAGNEFSMLRQENVIVLLRRALERQPSGDSEVKAMLMARLSAALVPPLPPEVEEQRRFGDESVAMARRLSSERALFYAMRFTIMNFPLTVSIRERFAISSELISLAVRLGEAGRVVTTMSNQVTNWLELGDLAGAEEQLRSNEQLLAPYPQVHYRWRPPLQRAVVAAVAGRWTEADASSREALRIAREGGDREGITVFSLFRQTGAYLRGDAWGWEEFEPLSMEMLAANPLVKFFRSIGDSLLGHHDRVDQSLRAFRERGIAGVPGPWAMAWPCVHSGLTEYAPFFYELCQRFADRMTLIVAPAGYGVMGPVQLVLGRLALMNGNPGAAKEHLAQSLELGRKLGSPPIVAQSQLWWAEAGETARAEEALEISTRLGMNALAERAKKLLGAAPVRSAPSATAATTRALSVTRDGEGWTLSCGAARLSLKDARGLGYLETLVRAPHEELHVLELEGRDEQADGGVLLDQQAKQEYRARLEELKEELEEAERFNDRGRAERARHRARRDRRRARARGGPGRPRSPRRVFRRARPGQRAAPPSRRGETGESPGRAPGPPPRAQPEDRALLHVRAYLADAVAACAFGTA